MRVRMWFPVCSGLATALVIVSFGACPVNAQQETAGTLPWPISLSRTAFRQYGNRAYAPAVFEMLSREATVEEESSLARIVPDSLGALLCYVGDHVGAAKRDGQLRERLGLRKVHGPLSMDGLAARPAVQEILERCRGRRVVMFNEEHRSSRQRAFMHELLAGLAEEGFTHLACETVTDGPGIQARGYPTVDSGTYSRDPVYADLLRRAAELGLRIVGYEATADELAPQPDDGPMDRHYRRESAQAAHLARLLGSPKARLIVFAGRHHIAESTGDMLSMGGAFKEQVCIDPLTIDLMLMEDRPHPEDEHVARRAARDADLLDDEAVVLVDENGEAFSSLPDTLDLCVFLPPTCLEDGRPDWLRLGGLRRLCPVDLDLDGLNLTEPALLQAIFAGESLLRAVPADQVVLRAGEEYPPLLLRPGAYIVRVVAANADVIWQADLQVD